MSFDDPAASPVAFAEDQPIKLLSPSPDHKKLVLEPEALKLLRSLNGPVSVVSIVGPQRGGKSTLLNLLQSRRPGGFSVGHKMESHTMGLWMRMRDHPRNPKMKVLFIDTEGLDAPHVEQSYNWALSTVVLLISNFFIYQTVASIDKAAIERLDLILKLATQVRHSGSSGENGPHFLWLIRDHHLNMKASPKDEMLDKLDEGARDAMKHCFKTYDCSPLPHPVDRDEDLAQIETLEFGKLSNHFREEFTILERSIFDMVLKPTQLGGRPVTGDVLGDLLQAYMEAIFSQDSGVLSDISKMPSQHQLLSQMAGEKAVHAGLHCYHEQMQRALPSLPVPSGTLQAQHRPSHQAARACFEQIAYLHEEGAAHYEALLEAGIAEWGQECHPATTKSIEEAVVHQGVVLEGGRFLDCWKMNLEASRVACLRESERIFGELLAKAAQFASVAAFQEASAAAIKAWDEACGPMPLSEVHKEKALAQLKGAERELRDSLLRQELASVEERLQQSLEGGLQRLQQSFEAQHSAMQDTLASQQSHFAEADGRIQSVAQEVQLVQQELQRHLGGNFADVESRLRGAQSSLGEVQGALTAQREDTVQQVGALRHELQQSVMDEAAKVSRTLGAQLTELKDSIGGSLEEATSSHDTLAKEVTQQGEELHSLGGQLATLKEERTVEEEARQGFEAKVTQGFAAYKKQLREMITEQQAQQAVEVAARDSLTEDLSALKGEVSSDYERLKLAWADALQEHQQQMESTFQEEKQRVDQSIEGVEGELATQQQSQAEELSKLHAQVEEKGDDIATAEGRLEGLLAELEGQLQSTQEANTSRFEQFAEDQATAAATIRTLEEQGEQGRMEGARHSAELEALTHEVLDVCTRFVTETRLSDVEKAVGRDLQKTQGHLTRSEAAMERLQQNVSEIANKMADSESVHADLRHLMDDVTHQLSDTEMRWNAQSRRLTEMQTTELERNTRNLQEKLADLVAHQESFMCKTEGAELGTQLEAVGNDVKQKLHDMSSSLWGTVGTLQESTEVMMKREVIKIRKDLAILNKKVLDMF